MANCGLEIDNGKFRDKRLQKRSSVKYEGVGKGMVADCKDEMRLQGVDASTGFEFLNV